MVKVGNCFYYCNYYYTMDVSLVFYCVEDKNIEYINGCKLWFIFLYP